MNLCQVLATAAIPFVIGTFSFVAPDRVNAQAPANRSVHAQRSDKKPDLFKACKPRSDKKCPPSKAPQSDRPTSGHYVLEGRNLTTHPRQRSLAKSQTTLTLEKPRSKQEQIP